MESAKLVVIGLMAHRQNPIPYYPSAPRIKPDKRQYSCCFENFNRFKLRLDCTRFTVVRVVRYVDYAGTGGSQGSCGGPVYAQWRADPSTTVSSASALVTAAARCRTVATVRTLIAAVCLLLPAAAAPVRCAGAVATLSTGACGNAVPACVRALPSAEDDMPLAALKKKPAAKKRPAAKKSSGPKKKIKKKDSKNSKKVFCIPHPSRFNRSRSNRTDARPLLDRPVGLAPRRAEGQQYSGGEEKEDAGKEACSEEEYG